MAGGSLFRNWPIGLVAVAATGVGLAVNHGGWDFLAGRGDYPVRFALPPVPETPNRASMMSLTEATAQSEQAPLGEELPALPDGSRNFAAAFASFDTPRTASRASPDGVMPLRFNLADPYAATETDAGPIELTKAVRVNGADAGSATIRVTEGATIAISGEELGRLLAQAGRRDLADSLKGAGGFVSFDRIRQAGMNVRYDPVSDRILVSS